MTNVPVSGCTLNVDGFAAIIRREAEERMVGSAKPFKELPSRVVRRFSRLEKGVISCLLGLGDDLGDAPIVLASRFGPMTNTLNLLKSICDNATMSPTAFSLSVHNAAVGVASQLAGNRGAHTAISAGPKSFYYGLIECEGLIAAGENQVVLMYSDCRLPGEYAHFGGLDADLQLAVLLSRCEAKTGLSVEPATSVFEVASALEEGEGRLTWSM